MDSRKSINDMHTLLVGVTEKNAISKMNEILKEKRARNHTKGSVRFFGWGFKDLTTEQVAMDFCKIDAAIQSGFLTPTFTKYVPF